MKAIDLSTASPSLAEILELASEDNIILRTVEGRQFVLAEIDDFAEEVEKVRQNEALMKLLDERSAEPTTYTLKQVRDQLQGNKRQRKGRKTGDT
jgi:hypothetical protein